jgi:hypothetical protein
MCDCAQPTRFGAILRKSLFRTSALGVSSPEVLASALSVLWIACCGQRSRTSERYLVVAHLIPSPLSIEEALLEGLPGSVRF